MNLEEAQALVEKQSQVASILYRLRTLTDLEKDFRSTSLTWRNLQCLEEDYPDIFEPCKTQINELITNHLAKLKAPILAELEKL